MRRTLLSLGVTTATAAAAVLTLTTAAQSTAPDDAQDQPPAKTLADDTDQGSGLYFEEIALTPANDKEAHVPIWFTLAIGGAEAA
jgi:hypothetical protein